ncbi:nucleoside diphosphate kinase [Phycomyces blakesleeanus]
MLLLYALVPVLVYQFLLYALTSPSLDSWDATYKFCHNLVPYLPPVMMMTAPTSLCQPQLTLGVIKPDGMAHLDLILDAIDRHGFRIVEQHTTTFAAEVIDEWYSDKLGRDFYPSLRRYLTRGECRVLVLERVDAIKALRRIIGPTDPQKARRVDPQSIRAQIGGSIQENAIHASDSEEAFERERRVLLPL